MRSHMSRENKLKEEDLCELLPLFVDLIMVVVIFDYYQFLGVVHGKHQYKALVYMRTFRMLQWSPQVFVTM